ncbi:MAG: sugar ABC transporter ATP-binding protein [Thermodesulfobacteriota bacterium]
MENSVLLNMERISKYFPGVKALDNVFFECRRGEVKALVGENGAGKSTLMKILAGVYRPDEGIIAYNGQKIELSSPRHAKDIGISIIHQERSLLPKLSIAKNIFLGREFTNRFRFVDSKLLSVKASEILEDVGLSLDPTLPVYSLDLAQQQLVEIAKALSLNAEVIVMDEPSAALTSEQLQRLFSIIHTLRGKNKTVIYISHRLDEIFEIADRVTVLKDGKLVGTKGINQVDKNELVEMMTGRAINQMFPVEKTNIGRDILIVHNLTSGKALKNISFSLRKTEILSIYGLLGSGRTELARALFGIYPIDKGEVYLNGEKLDKISPAKMIRKGVSYIPRNRKEEGLLLGLSVRENISLASLDKLFSKHILINGTKEELSIRKSIEQLNIQCSGLDQLTKYLSGGNQQKVVLAKWLLVNSEIIIADEPTWGIDVGAKMEMYKILRKLAAEGKAVLMISSELPEILGLSDRILVMRKGEISGEFLVEHATEKELLKLAI